LILLLRCASALIGYLKTPEEKNNKIITVIIIVTIASHVGFYMESPFFGAIYLLC
jgi:hypothetical protein